MAGQPVGLRHGVRWLPDQVRVRALRRGETRGLADTWLRPTHAYTHAYTHAFREVDAQLSARERVVANLLLTEGRTA